MSCLVSTINGSYRNCFTNFSKNHKNTFPLSKNIGISLKNSFKWLLFIGNDQNGEKNEDHPCPAILKRQVC